MRELINLADAGANLTPTAAQAPVGVFDSGIGGLSVLRHIHALLPNEQLMYFADSGYAPYGDRSEDEIVARTLAVAAFLMQHQVKALVVACNTATAAAIKALREHHPELPLVGVEPGLKPAAAQTQSRVVGVLATQRTLGSARFAALRAQIAAATQVEFVVQPCIGLADQIEKGELYSPATAVMLHRYVKPLIDQGADTLVLGCTHYPFVQPLLEEVLEGLTPRRIAIIDTGVPVARQLQRLLTASAVPASTASTAGTTGDTDDTGGHPALAVTGYTTGSASSLANAFDRLLHWTVPVVQVNTA